LNSANLIKTVLLNRGGSVSIHNTLHKWLADDHYNADKFCRRFNFRTQMDLKEGIRREVAWYRRGSDETNL